MAAKTLLYLLGPMTGYHDFNRPAFHKWAKFLRGEGFDVINPAELDEVMGDAAEVSEYYRRDAEFLAKADGGAAMPGWRQSKGATWESYTLGVMFKKPVFELPDMGLVGPDDLPYIRHPGGSIFSPTGWVGT